MRAFDTSKYHETARLTKLMISGLLIALMLALAPSCNKYEEEGATTPSDLALRKSKSLDIQLVAENLVSPLGLLEAPDQSKRLFIFDQTGKILIVDSNGTLLSTPFFDISSRLVSLNAVYD